jgi:hypothetical protein
MFLGKFPLGDGDETCQPCLGGEQIVVTVVEAAFTDVIANAQ